LSLLKRFRLVARNSSSPFRHYLPLPLIINASCFEMKVAKIGVLGENLVHDREVTTRTEKKPHPVTSWMEKAIQPLASDVHASEPEAGKRKGARKPAKKAKAAKKARQAKKASRKPQADRTNKKAEVIAMIQRAKGATLDEIMKATGWQRHTVRGFVSILGSKGGIRFRTNPWSVVSAVNAEPDHNL
jgi:Protein of unknown function (DUF3489)